MLILEFYRFPCGGKALDIRDHCVIDPPLALKNFKGVDLTPEKNDKNFKKVFDENKDNLNDKDALQKIINSNFAY